MRTRTARPLLAGIAMGLAGMATVIGGLVLTLSEQRAQVAAPASILRNVEIVAASSAEAAINFDYQLAPGSSYGSVRFTVWPTECTAVRARRSAANSWYGPLNTCRIPFSASHTCVASFSIK